MSEALQKLSIGEMKFRDMVTDLMVMERPSMTIECPNQSKARNLRRMFYHWSTRIAERERKFLSTLEYKVSGRTIQISRKADWQPVETSAALGAQDESNREGKSA